MKEFIPILLTVAFCFFGYWLYVRIFKEKKTKEPERTAHAELIARDVVSGTQGAGRSTGGCSYRLTFRLDDGTELELYAYDKEYGALREGMTGELTWKGPYYVKLDLR